MSYNKANHTDSPLARLPGVGRQTFAFGSGVREIARLRRIYGKDRWRKRKGIANIEFENGTQKQVQLHWYETTGIGRKEYKIKQILK